jgi:hypothetical protein
MSLVEKVFRDRPCFKDKLNRTHYLIDFYPEQNLLHTWVILGGHHQECVTRCIGLPPQKVERKVLESIDIWDRLHESIRQEIQDGVVLTKEGVILTKEEKQERREKMLKAHKGRKSKTEYADLPRLIPCSNNKCDKVDYIAPGILEKKAGLKGLEGEERTSALKVFLDSYECKECRPRKRGKTRNPLYKDIPYKIHCKECGKECSINAKNVYEKTGGNLDKIKEYCQNYLCRSCNPEWGSWLKGKSRVRKPKPENVGFPKQV